jgi:aminomethyltransferase
MDILPNETGGIVDDLLVYHLDDGHYMCVVNAGNIDKDWAWFNQHNTEGAELHNISEIHCFTRYSRTQSS